MEHCFNVKFAQEYGVTAAILYRYMQFWISKNKANNKHFHDGRTWTYNSVRAFCELFPYLGDGKTRLALELLVERDILLIGNYNKRKSDRTSWYAFVDEETALSGLPAHLIKSQMDNKAKKPICDKCKSICDNNESICDKCKALPVVQSNPNTLTQITNNDEKDLNDILVLDCNIKTQAKFLAEQLERIFMPGTRSKKTFANIIRYFITSAQADHDKISWFKDAVEWAKVAKIDGRVAGGKALFVQTVKNRTGYGGKPKLLQEK